MSRNLQILKKTVLTLALLLMTTASAWALTITIPDGQTVSTNYTVASGETVTISVSSGTGIYSGIISGGSTTCTITKTGAGKVIITNANTVSGSTITISAGTLQLGNGTTNGTFDNMTSWSISSGATLRFELSTGITFSKVISGSGKVEYKGANTNIALRFSGNNTYTGGTTIEGGALYIGNGGTTGSITGNVNIQSGSLIFYRTDEHTFNGIISGAGGIGRSAAAGKTILTGENTYTGETAILAGTIQVGNGTSGSIANTSNVAMLLGTLRFEPGAPMIFSKVISGSGKVEYKGTDAKKLYLTGNNTYTGTTTIEAGGDLYIGNNTTTGAIVGDIINNGKHLFFYRSDDYTYSGKISGTGIVWATCNGKLTFTGDNTYTGKTYISGDGTLQIGNNTATGSIIGDIENGFATVRFARSDNYTYSGVISGYGNVEQYGSGNLALAGVNTYTGKTLIGTSLYLGYDGSIENSSEVILLDEPKPIFHISSDKKIKALSSYNSSAEVAIESTKTLTIGTAGEEDGTGNFSGKFTGKGSNVTKTGTGAFTMSGANETIGVFTHSQGTVKLSGIWVGDYMKGPGATLTVVGNPTIGRKLTLSGGDINMNLKTTPPSKLSVTGAVEALEINTLNITTNAISDYVLMEAATGIKPEAYMVNSTLHSHLSGNDKQLLLSASPQYIAPTITINTIPSGVTGTTFSETLTAVGLNPITWSIESRSLPDGLSFNEQTGEISGTPTTTGTFPFRVRATNSLGSDFKDLLIKVTNDVIAPTIITTQLPNGTIEVSYNKNLDLEGSSSITWTLQSGNLPDGLTLSSKGIISGTPTALGRSTFTVKAENSAGQDTKELTLLITDGMGIAPTTLSNRITVYPNPTTGVLKITNYESGPELNSGTNVEVFDIYGRKQKAESRMGDEEIVLNISNLPAGVYFLRIQTENKMITQKIIKN